MKEITLGQILTPQETARAIKLYYQLKDSGTYATTICDQIIQPNIARINKALGQENDPKYIAYVVEYAMTLAETK